MSLQAFIALHNMMHLPVFTKGTMKVMLALANAASDDGYEFCGVDTLLRRTGLSHTAFHVHLRALKEAGLVEDVPASEQPRWVRKRIRGSRIAVHKVPVAGSLERSSESPDDGPELPTVGTAELPTVGTSRNLKRGRKGPGGRDSWSPGGRDSWSPGGRDTDPACAPASDPESTPKGPTPSAQASAVDSAAASGRLRGPESAGPEEDDGGREIATAAPGSGVSQIAQRLAADLASDWIADMDSLGRVVAPATKAAVERNAAKVIAGPVLRRWMRSDGLTTAETISAEQVADAIWDAWLHIRQSGHHVAEGLALPWLLSRPRKCVEHALAQRDADASAQSGPVAEARSIMAWWEDERARLGVPADITVADCEPRLVALLVRGDATQRTKAPAWIRAQLALAVGDPAARLGWLSYSFTNMSSAGGNPASARRPTSAEVARAARAAVPLGRPVPMRIIEDEGDET